MLQLTPTNPETIFTVTEKNINNYNTLLPNVLYKTMEEFATNIVATNFELVDSSPKLYQLQILKNAFLNDQLKLQSKIKKFNENELQLSIIVVQHNENAAICKAIFKFPLKNTVSVAS